MSALIADARRPLLRRDKSTESLLCDLFTRIGEVSSIPEVALQIIELADDPVAGAADLLDVIQQDPALAVRIMRTVNSSYYGLSRRVADLKRAITLLGFKEIRNLVLSVYVADLFRQTGGHGPYSRRGLWQHMVGAGAIARLIARTSGKVPPQEAYLAGLLHDLGLILIDQYLHAPFCRVVDALSADRPLCAVESEILGFDHTILGEFVAARWQLPPQLTTAIRHHHASDEYDGPHAPLVQAVELANIFCHLKDRSSLGVRNTDLPSGRVFAGLDLGEAQVAQVWEQVDAALEAAEPLAVL